MSNGDFLPGTVCVFLDGDWYQTVEEDCVDRDEDTYVLIHGAHSSIRTPSITQLADELHDMDPNANILAVDWGYFARMDSTKVDVIIQEAMEDWLEEVLGQNILDSAMGTESDYQEIFDRHLGQLVQRIILNLVPMEQANEIPFVAEVVEGKLFEEWGKEFEVYVTDRTTGEKVELNMLCLGLDPERTYLIGHSHGAHVAGMIGMYAQENDRNAVRRIIALDPSTPLCHKSEENLDGNGWNRNAASYVDVYRRTTLFSSEKIYGDRNIYLVDPDNPAYQEIPEDSAPEIVLAAVIELIQYENQLHSQMVDIFIDMVRNGDFRQSLKYHKIVDDPQWIVIE